MTVLLITKTVIDSIVVTTFIMDVISLLISFSSITDKCYQTYDFYQHYLTSNTVGF